MSNKIIDQYTDRKDLSPSRKWQLRHPEKARDLRRKWAIENLEYHRVYEAKRRRTAKANSIKEEHSKLVNNILLGNRISKHRVAEILRFHERGKDVGTIAIWTNLPVSAVMKVLQSQPNPEVRS